MRSTVERQSEAAEKDVRDIRRVIPRHYTAEEKGADGGASWACATD